jgi:RNA polymerase sigma-70 factor (ECF subfamily)
MASKPAPDHTPASGNSEQDDLSLLMARYQDADQQGVEELVGRLSPILYRFFLSSTRDQTVSEDLLQECWMRIHRARHSYRRGQPLLPWVFAIARHTQLDNFRRRSRRHSREIPMDSLPENQHYTTQPRLAGGQNFENLLAQLPESQREVIVMMKVSGMTLEEVANATSSTVGAVKQKAHRAYEKLRRILTERNESQR